jgi:regulator of RNase E activity RraA
MRGRAGGITTALVADCLKTDLYEITGLRKLCGEDQIVLGPVVRARTDGKILPVVYALACAQPGDILLVDNRDANCDKALLGDIILAECALKGIVGVICTGFVRDIAQARQLGIPVWAAGLSPRPADFGTPKSLGVNDVARRPQLWAFADEDGVLTAEIHDPQELIVRCLLKKRREDRYLEEMKQSSLTEAMNIVAHVEEEEDLRIGF